VELLFFHKVMGGDQLGWGNSHKGFRESAVSGLSQTVLRARLLPGEAQQSPPEMTI
jgi:hypothetical protein